MSKKQILKLERKMALTNAKSNLNSIAIMVSIFVIVVGTFGIVYLLTNKNSNTGSDAQTKAIQTPVDNVAYVDNKQIIEIGVKGGYTPKNSIAKAGIPTILKFKTNGTYDCSSSLRIPSLDISKNLPGSGETEIDIGSQDVGKLAGTCSMGMYFFEVDFQS